VLVPAPSRVRIVVSEPKLRVGLLGATWASAIGENVSVVAASADRGKRPQTSRATTAMDQWMCARARLRAPIPWRDAVNLGVRTDVRGSLLHV
jgi:hypothetical protein